MRTEIVANKIKKGDQLGPITEVTKVRKTKEFVILTTCLRRSVDMGPFIDEQKYKKTTKLFIYTRD